MKHKFDQKVVFGFLGIAGSEGMIALSTSVTGTIEIRGWKIDGLRYKLFNGCRTHATCR